MSPRGKHSRLLSVCRVCASVRLISPTVSVLIANREVYLFCRIRTVALLDVMPRRRHLPERLAVRFSVFDARLLFMSESVQESGKFLLD